ncbi:hypothetical protein K0A97_00080 [Patescibacteria group bacterium]|nr:hypothetical protein [Patescibacteria group bacterium]
MNKESNLIHVKFLNKEAVNAKRDILLSEMNLLKIAKAIRAYGFYKSQELEIKTGLFVKIRDLKTIITKLQKVLPPLDLPGLIKKGREEERLDDIEYKTKSKPLKYYDKSLEEQLKDIQERLGQLQSRSF